MSKTKIFWLYKCLICVIMLMIHTFVSAQGYWKPIQPQFDALVTKLDSLSTGDTRTVELMNKLKNVAAESKDPIIQARYLYWKAVTNFELDTTIQTKELFEKALSLVDSSKYLYDYARIQFAKNNPVMSQGSYVNLYNTYMNLCPIFRSIGDVYYEAWAYQGLGIIMTELGEYQSALQFFLTADSLFQGIKKGEKQIKYKLNIAIVYANLKQEEKAKEILYGMLKQNSIQNDTSFLITIYTNLYNTSSNLDEKDMAVYKAYNLAMEYKKNLYMIALTQLNLADRHLSHKEYDQALSLFQSVLNSSQKNNFNRFLISAYLGLSQSQAGKGLYKEAFYNFEKSENLKDSLRGIDKVSEINNLRFKSEIKEYQNQLIIEQQKAELYKVRTIIIILISVCIVLAFIVFIIYFVQKKHLTDAQLESKELLAQNLQQQIDSQNRELSTTTLVLNEKNVILKNIQTQLKLLFETGEISSTSKQVLDKLISNSLQSENEWEKFKLHFEKVHPDFFIKLKNEHDTLTENDLKLCAYIRIGLSAKQIGQMISVLPNTIKTNRYLLKKKLNIDADITIDDYIKSL